MNEQEIEESAFPGGYFLLRADGQIFMLLGKPDGHAVLYHGNDIENPPIIGLVDFDVNIADKIAAARRWVLAYPEQPEL